MSRHKNYPLRYVARVTVEFDTPFHVGTGQGDDLVDAVILTDANGLPTIPGDSIAGVLRHAMQKAKGEKVVDDIFGYVRLKTNEVRGSRLSVSWAYIHNSKKTPVTGLLPPQDLAEDELLLNARAPSAQIRNKITHRGTADKKNVALFNEYYTDAGHRFTFELKLSGNENDKKNWQVLLHLLHTPAVRLGGKTRSGKGAFSVHRIRQRCFNMNKREDFEAFMNLNSDLAVDYPDLLPDIFKKDDTVLDDLDNSLTLLLPIVPEHYWMFGGGEDSAGAADVAPIYGTKIIWSENVPQIKEFPMIPGSSIKGALAHRVAYHFNRLVGNFADTLLAETQSVDCNDSKANSDEILADYSSAKLNQGVCELFGEAIHTNSDTGHKGLIAVDDFLITPPPKQQLIPHVVVDRFTGASMNLFNERPFYQGKLDGLKIIIHDYKNISKISREALCCCIKDLYCGFLSLGAGAGRGLGYFKLKEELSKDEKQSLESFKKWAQKGGE